MYNKPLVSVLILTFDHTDFLKSCLDSAIQSDYPNLEFIVSDNGSRDDIAGFVKENYSKNKIKVVRLEENRGLTGGFNYGYQFCSGKYIIILSNDTKIAKDAISQMVSMAERDSKIGIISPQIIQMKKPDFFHHAGSFITITGLLYHYGVLQKIKGLKYQKNYYIFSCNGSGFLIRKVAVDKCGLFDEDFFFFYDESDLSHRVWISGYTVVYNYKARIWHLWSGTMQGANPKIWYYNHRNHISSLLRNLTVPYLVVMLLSYSIILICWFLLNLFKLRFDVCLTLPQVYLWHFFHIGETIRKRKLIQSKLRKVSDNEIFKKCMIFPDWKYFLFYLSIKYEDKDLPQRVMYLK